jgi:hypothetical protein
MAAFGGPIFPQKFQFSARFGAKFSARFGAKCSTEFSAEIPIFRTLGSKIFHGIFRRNSDFPHAWEQNVPRNFPQI